MGYFGGTQTRTIGETFAVVATAPRLSYFTLWLADDFAFADGTIFTPYVEKWDGSKAVGPPLWVGATVTTKLFTGFQPFTFNTGDLSLAPGQLYVAFLQTPRNANQSDYSGIGCTCLVSSDPDFVAVAADAADGTYPSTGPWAEFGYSASFQAGFDAAPIVATPEPSSIVYCITGLTALCAGYVGRRRSDTPV